MSSTRIPGCCPDARGHRMRESTRYLAQALSYGSEKAVPFLVVLIPALTGSNRESVGRIELLVTSVFLIAAVATLGTDKALKLERFRSNRLSILFAMSASAGLAAGLGAGVVGLIVGFGTRAWIAGILAASAGAISRLNRERLRVEPRLTYLVLTSLLGVTAFLIAMALFHRMHGMEVSGPVLALAISFVVEIIPGLVVYSRLEAVREPRLLRDMVRFGGPLVVVAAAYWIIAASDRYMLVLFTDLTTVAVYGLTYRFVMLLSGVASTVVVWWENDSYARGWRWSWERVRTRTVVAVLLGVGVGAVLVWPLSVAVMRVARYPDLGSAFRISSVLVLAILAMFAARLLLVPVTVAAATRFVGGVWVVAATVNVATNGALIPLWGGIGAATATAAAYGTAALLAGLYVWKNRELRLSVVSESIDEEGESC